MVAALTFAGATAGRVELGTTLVTTAGLAPLALELGVTEITGGAGWAVLVCEELAAGVGCAVRADATTTVDACEPELANVAGAFAAGAAAGGALVAAADTEFPGWGWAPAVCVD